MAGKAIVVVTLLLVLVAGASASVTPVPYNNTTNNETLPTTGMPTAPTPTWNLLLRYFMYSMAAFCNKPQAQGLYTWTCSWCTYIPGTVPVHVTNVFQESGGLQDVYGYIGYASDSIVISFRGSVTVGDWLNDMGVIQVQYGNVKGATVHTGFYGLYNKVSAQILPVVQQLAAKYPNLPIICTGHSLGAALTLLTAADLGGKLGLGSRVQVWNFGEPRVGNPGFAAYVNKVVPVVYRVINQHDIVPHLPPQWPGYQHAHTEIWFKSDYKNFVVCSSSTGEDPKCTDSLSALSYKPTDHLVYLGYGPGGMKPANAC